MLIISCKNTENCYLLGIYISILLMKRLHILLLVLVVLWVATRWLVTEKQAPLVPPFTQPTQQVTTGAILTGDDTATTGDTLATGNIDDTELPLDQNSGDMPQDGSDQPSDAEVEEIINLLEELIAENEWN
jgi:hypothetical protein